MGEFPDDDGGEVLRLLVGRIDRPHGLHGQVIVTLTTTEKDRLAPGTVLHSDRGELTVVSSAPSRHRFIVSFAGVSTREGAEALAGTVLSADHLDDTDVDPDALWIHELIGAEVVDSNGNHYGSVESVQDNPASDLLVLESGALVPLTFVVGWIDRPNRLEIDPPAGLIDPI